MQSKETGRSTLNCRGILRISSTWRRSGGFGLIGWIIAIPLVIAALLIIIIAFYEGRKAYWDFEVRKLCAKDGGGKVLRTVALSKQEHARLINKFGKFEIPLDRPEAENAAIVQKQTSTYIRRNDPEVRQDLTVIIRKVDNAILAEKIIYSRVGGDLIALHPSYFSCPEMSMDIYSAVVRQNGVKE